MQAMKDWHKSHPHLFIKSPRNHAGRDNKVADCGLDALDGGRKVYGFTLLITATLISCGSAFFLPWLIFGSGLAQSLP